MSKKPRPSSVPSPSVAPIINRVKAKGHGLGRLASVDIRDHSYLAKPRRAAANVRSRYYYVGKPEDQGQTPQCVGYSTHKFLTAGPVRNVKGIPTPTEIYAAAQTRDEWPGEDYEGTSVRGAFKYLSEVGYIGEYNWAFDLETCVNWLLTVGPMVVGTIWLADMFDPDAKGFLRVSGDNVGGHAWPLIGCNRDRKCPDGSKGAFRMMNSWGAEWGQKGQAWVSFVDFEKLLREDGEAACAREILKPS